MTPPRWTVLSGLFVLLWLMGCPPSPDGQIHVDLKTDLTPFVEFDALRLAVIPGELGAVYDHLAEPADYLRGHRLDSLTRPLGDTVLQVALYQAGEIVVTKRVLVHVNEGSQAVTLVISRDCRGVMCPASGNPALDTCLGGRCVDPRCTPQTPEFCPPPLCSQNSDCRVASCASPLCEQGVCLAEPNSRACDPQDYCDGTLGCRPRPVDQDAGPDADAAILRDAGTDSPDAGPVPAAVLARSPENGFLTGSLHVPSGSPIGRHPLRPQFRWDETMNAAHYQLQITQECERETFDVCSFSTPTIDERVEETSFTPASSLMVQTAVPVGTRYYWRVRACTADERCSAWTRIRYLDVGRPTADYNGDGYSDLSVGAWFGSMPEFQEGATFVYFGSSSGIATRPNLTIDNPLGQPSGRFGRWVSDVGDVNGDGFADLLAGAYWQDTGADHSGSAYLFYGSPTGPSSSPDVILDNPSPAANSFFGLCLDGLGDMDGDGYADFAVAAPRQSLPESGEGVVYFYRGSASGPNGLPDLVIDNPLDEAGGQFGYFVSTAGDVDGDGFRDLLVGAPGQDDAMELDVGLAYVFRGGLTGLETEPSLTIHSPAPVARGQFGQGIAGVGDVNGDGFADLIVGATGEGSTREGLSHVLLGRRSGTPTVSFTLHNPSGLADTGLGWNNSGGDLNGDGFSDLAFGAYLDGELFVVFGAPSITERVDWTTTGAASYAISVTARGDVNGDGFADLFVGESSGNRVLGFYGSHTGLGLTPDISLTDPDGRRTDFGIAVAN